MASGPLNIQPWQVVLERALAHPEHIGSLTSQYPADETPTMPGEPYDLLYGDACLSLFEDCRVGILTPKIALILDALGGGQQVGIMVAEPTARRTWRIDLPTASKKAWLAFSMRCQRSATWVACGSALVAARA